MTSQAKRLRGAAMRLTGLGARHWSCRTNRNSAGEWTDACLHARGAAGNRALYDQAEAVARECGYCRVWKLRTSSGGFSAWAATGGPKGGLVIDLDKSAARVEAYLKG